MTSFFVADVHLDIKQPSITEGFLRFLHRLPDGSNLYILGDLFDYWVGDDILTDFHQQIAGELAALSGRNIKTYFIQGNRDFMIGQPYAALCKMTLLPDVTLITPNNIKVVILHGDTLCTNDVSYQRFRRFTRIKFYQKIFLWLPRSFRQKLGGDIRKESRKHNKKYNSEKSAYILDVNQDTVVETMEKYQATIMIHGHTHKPAVHQFEMNGQPVQRIVLGAWHDACDYVVFDEAPILLPFMNLS
ncbi:UDP-2,3-diacylglucosamine diphosphatase [Zophobihabitans entericus]|uniref:UDP-2,3-diacylglucosamine hydrolase n=1 Tax=Zophobihabitans entericus TaxID=1635327 RepID=A0A6G9IC04_9GAMM|nr:UDP-2,3-diacylglucosamine diphosphatase [Zophobihabitans entericus]QIQ21743.1 UDP-2,3-diacylglucosamine diphosphatase [Zophobihabitans entericus]